MSRRTPIVDDLSGSEKASGDTRLRFIGRVNPAFARVVIAVLASGAVVACGPAAQPAATNAATSTPAPATSAATPVSTPVAVLPSGGPAPSQLIGSWYQTAAHTTVLTLTATRYVLRDTAEQGNGAITVNGSEIDFFSGTLCPLVLPQGVGRYRWMLQGDQLHLAPLNTDPCGRTDLLANQSYTKRVS